MISATMIADSINDNGIRLRTFEIEYPRFILGEVNTHRVFSRNSASSRAIPIDKMIAKIEEAPAMPVSWGLNEPGMKATTEHTHAPTCAWAWRRACEGAVAHARTLQSLGLHKQIVNRVIEPYQTMKTILTGTEFDNFFELRSHPDAQPEIKALSEAMEAASASSTPTLLKEGEWHVPYYNNGVWRPSSYTKGDEELDSKHGATLSEARMISSSCCAQVSYRNLDDSLEKATRIYRMLVETKPIHASPFEHQASPITAFDIDIANADLPLGVTHIDRNSETWSGNFRDWIQYRQVLGYIESPLYNI